MKVGVFDSGVGGLTVLKALRQSFPAADLLYLGDTARVPYGSRSAPTVRRYALECAAWLVAEGCEQLVIACNTASAYGADAVRARFPDLIVNGVVEAGARAAALRGSGPVAVLATRGSVASGAYPAAIERLSPDAHVEQVACPLLVPLIEEGWHESEVTGLVIDRYLAELPDRPYQALILGCTHFPVIHDLIAQRISAPVIDSSLAVAEQLRGQLGDGKGQGRTDFALTDDPQVSLGAIQAIYGEPVRSVRRVSLT